MFKGARNYTSNTKNLPMVADVVPNDKKLYIADADAPSENRI